MSFPLVMTATIDPGDCPWLKLRDPSIRIDHYLSSLIMWVENGPFDKIIFCENSGQAAPFSKLGRWAAEHGKKLEIITFQGNEGTKSQGKGFGEGVILEKALQSSDLLRVESGFFKVTGRLYVENAAKIHDRHIENPCVFTLGDTRFFKTSMDLFNGFLAKRYINVHDGAGNFLEDHYKAALKPLMGYRAVPFSLRPVIVGWGGTNNEPYDGDFTGEVRSKVRRFRQQIGLWE
jgi:hypothetical protein